MSGLLKEFWLFLKQEKKWWLLPMLSVMGIVAALVIFASTHAGIAPFIYPFF